MKRIEFMRRNRGLTKRQLSEMLNFRITDVSKLEKRVLDIHPRKAARLADALGWEGDPMELFEEIEDPKINLYRNEEE